MTIRSEREARIAVSEKLLQCFYIYTLSKRIRCESMSQVVGPDLLVFKARQLENSVPVRLERMVK